MRGPADDEFDDFPLDPESSSICERFEELLKSGVDCRIEEFLDETQVPDPSTLLSRLVRIELRHRMKKGERPLLDEYYRRFPDNVDTIRPLTRFIDRLFRELGLANAERQVRHYALKQEIGIGGFGLVWEARDEKLNRRVAIKQIDRSAIERHDFDAALREAQIAAQLTHPHIVQTYDYFEEEDGLYLVTQLVDGTDLKQKLQSDQQPTLAQITKYSRQIAEALEYAHGKSVIHRDVKPSNILIDENDDALLCDFGVAHWGGTKDTLSGKNAENIIGTAAYIPPEQAQGRDAVPASDIYSLGIVLYEGMTGRLPFHGSAREHAFAHLTLAVVPPRKISEDIPKDLETICLRCVQKVAAQRYPSAAALATDLSLFEAGEPIHARPITRLQRAWRWIRQRPAVSTSVAGMTLCFAILPMLVTVPAPNGKTQVTVQTNPEGAEVLIFPVDPQTGLMQESTPLHVKAAPGSLALAPGQYWVQAIKQGVITEFLRTVPEDVNELATAWNYRKWEPTGANSMSWPAARLREKPRLEGMVYIPGATDFPVRKIQTKDGDVSVIRKRFNPFYIATTERKVRDFVDRTGRLPLHQQTPDKLDAPLSARYDQALSWAEVHGARLPTEYEFDYVSTLQSMHQAGDYAEIDRILAKSNISRDQLLANLDQLKNLRNGAAEWVLGEVGLYPDLENSTTEPDFPEHAIHWKVLKGGHVDFDSDRPEDFEDVEPGYRYLQRYFVIRPGTGFRLVCPAGNEMELARSH